MTDNVDLELAGDTLNSYATMKQVEDLGTHHGGPYTSATKPTAAAVQSFLNDRTEQIDSRLAQVGVVVPVDKTSSPRAYALLAKLCTYGAAADAQNAAYFLYNREGVCASAAHYEKLFQGLLNIYSGDGTGKTSGNPKLLRDAVFTQDAPVWPRGAVMDSATSDLWAAPDPNPISSPSTFASDEVF